MNDKIKKIKESSFLRFVLVGGILTLMDWIMFYILAIRLNMQYLIALVIIISIGAVLNFIFNKTFTFKNRSKKIFRQFSVFLLIVTFYLISSSLLMYLLVSINHLDKMLSRIFVSFIMLFVNYILNKNLTFNKRLFE